MSTFDAALAAIDRDALIEKVLADLTDIWPEQMAWRTKSDLQWGRLVATVAVDSILKGPT